MTTQFCFFFILDSFGFWQHTCRFLLVVFFLNGRVNYINTLMYRTWTSSLSLSSWYLAALYLPRMYPAPQLWKNCAKELAPVKNWRSKVKDIVSPLTLICSMRCILTCSKKGAHLLFCFFFCSMFAVPQLSSLQLGCSKTFDEVESMWHYYYFLGRGICSCLSLCVFWVAVCVNDDWSSSTGWCR